MANTLLIPSASMVSAASGPANPTVSALNLNAVIETTSVNPLNGFLTLTGTFHLVTTAAGYAQIDIGIPLSILPKWAIPFSNGVVGCISINGLTTNAAWVLGVVKSTVATQACLTVSLASTLPASLASADPAVNATVTLLFA